MIVKCLQLCSESSMPTTSVASKATTSAPAVKRAKESAQSGAATRSAQQTFNALYFARDFDSNAIDSKKAAFCSQFAIRSTQSTTNTTATSASEGEVRRKKVPTVKRPTDNFRDTGTSAVFCTFDLRISWPICKRQQCAHSCVS